MSHFPFEIFSIFWGDALLNFEVESLMFVKQNTWKGRRGKVIVNLSLLTGGLATHPPPNSTVLSLQPYRSRISLREKQNSSENPEMSRHWENGFKSQKMSPFMLSPKLIALLWWESF